jgi:8-oxo-dGTP diphosphatase
MDPDDRVLLVRFDWPDGGGVWAAPGGGIDSDEAPCDALARELVEEAGLMYPEIGPEIWRRTHLFPFIDGSHDGQSERFYLVRTPHFEPEPAMTQEQLTAEYFGAIRWWTLTELRESPESFAPRRLPELIEALVSGGPPEEPIDVGV